MALPLYLAMTAAEMRTNAVYPAHLGYMACHFSPYGTGLCNLPGALPPGAMLILNDRIPICGHDPILITEQLIEAVEVNRCSCILLDFQHPDIKEAYKLAKYITASLPCPVGIPHLYSQDLDCPVFLPPVPLDEPITKYLAPWLGQEIWLEFAREGQMMTLTELGCTVSPLPYPDEAGGHIDETLHSHYTIDLSTDAAAFTLFRTKEDFSKLLNEAEKLGVTRAVGLWQELQHA